MGGWSGEAGQGGGEVEAGGGLLTQQLLYSRSFRWARQTEEHLPARHSPGVGAVDLLLCHELSLLPFSGMHIPCLYNACIIVAFCIPTFSLSFAPFHFSRCLQRHAAHLYACALCVSWFLLAYGGAARIRMRFLPYHGGLGGTLSCCAPARLSMGACGEEKEQLRSEGRNSCAHGALLFFARGGVLRQENQTRTH